jgi:integral membrane sensor domain MASE1
MTPGLVLVANGVIGVALVGAGGVDRLVRIRRSALLACLPLAAAGVLILYVFGEDSYRRNGTSRWDAYRSPGGALGSMFVLSVALLVACGAALAYAGVQGRERVFRVAAVTSGLASLILVTATVIGFSSN